jgi:hypothetical protein
MNARAYLVTAGAVLALAGPAVHTAGASIPADEHSGSKATAAVSHQVRGGALKSSSTAVRVGAYNAHAYVHGGASKTVAKAITKAGKKKAATTKVARVVRPRLPITSSPSASGGSIPEPCLLDNICTVLQSCELLGLNCELLEPASYVTDGSQAAPSTEEIQPVETPVADEVAPAPPATDPTAVDSSTSDTSQDC